MPRRLPSNANSAGFFSLGPDSPSFQTMNGLRLGASYSALRPRTGHFFGVRTKTAYPSTRQRGPAQIGRKAMYPWPPRAPGSTLNELPSPPPPPPPSQPRSAAMFSGSTFFWGVTSPPPVPPCPMLVAPPPPPAPERVLSTGSKPAAPPTPEPPDASLLWPGPACTSTLTPPLVSVSAPRPPLVCLAPEPPCASIAPAIRSF